MPQLNQIHVDQALTNLSLAYTNDEYVGTKVMPKLPVKKRTDLYFVYGKEYLRYAEARVNPGDVATDFDYSLSRGSFHAQRRAHRHLVTDDEIMEEDVPLDARIDATEALTERLNLVLEVDIAGFVTNPANITNNTALSGTSQWTDYVNSTPLTNIKTAKASVRNQTIKRANSLVISYEGALDLADHPSIKELIKYTDPRSLADSGLPPVIRGLTVIEAGAVKDTSIEGQTFSPAAAWGNNVLVAYISPGAGRRKLSLGWTFMAPDATTNMQGIATRRYRDEERNGEWTECFTTYDIVLTAPGAGYLYTNVY